MIVEHVYAFTEFQGLLMRKRVYVILIVPDKSAPGVDLDKVANYLLFFLTPLSFLISFLVSRIWLHKRTIKNSFFLWGISLYMEHILYNNIYSGIILDFDKLTKKGTAYVFRYLVAGFRGF